MVIKEDSKEHSKESSKESSPPRAGKVLLTGGTGFIASHILDCLLEQNFDVVVTVRTEEKGHRIIRSIDGALSKHVSFAVVPNVAADGAFDEALVLNSDPPFDYVVHTASPYQLHFEDPVRDCLDPAIKGTTGILKSVHEHAPTVKRVVITSSSAAMLSPSNHPAVYDESCWSNITLEQAHDPKYTYPASKKFAEQAAWAFHTTHRPTFTLATINNTYTFGPLPRTLTSLKQINTSNQRILDLVQGHWRTNPNGNGIPPTAPVFTFVDVRDVALAHVRAMVRPEAGGQRFYVVGEFFSNARLVRVVREGFPQLGGWLPSEGEEKAAEDFDEEGHWGFDNKRSREVLGVEYRGLGESVVDAVESILRFEGPPVVRPVTTATTTTASTET